MGSIKRERGVLKLVHPGRHIEVHREPIRASEVMRKNPRHCITRPDIFKLPWIVVKPESILLPGSVFLIVPNRTIYDLLKAKGQINQSSFSQPNSQQFKLDLCVRNHIENVCKYDLGERSQNQSESTFEFRPYYKAAQYYQNYNRDKEAQMLKKDVNLEFVTNQEVNMLKSCLRRSDSMRKSLNLKVSFNMSIQEEEHRRNIQGVS